MSTAKKILVVEDDDLFRETVASSLRKKLYSVQEAPDGLAAKQLLTMEPFDLLLRLSNAYLPNKN
jgi:CheY-like chemotaxis protein